MKKLLFALVLGLGAFVFAPAKAEAFFFRCFPCQPCGGSGGSRVTTQCQWPTQAAPQIITGASGQIPLQQGFGCKPCGTNQSPVRVSTSCQWPTQSAPQIITGASGQIVLPSPESVGIDPLGSNYTPNFPYPNTGPNNQWIVYPNQGNCPNGNCPQPIRIR
jgi:hypothetical protein